MDPFEVHKEARRRKAIERLGSRNARCAICGEGDPHCLELHHLAGERFGDDLVPVCRNCHRKLSDDQKDHPRPVGKEPDPVEKIAHLLLGLADLLVLVAERLKAFGLGLIEKVRSAPEEGAQP